MERMGHGTEWKGMKRTGQKGQRSEIYSGIYLNMQLWKYEPYLKMSGTVSVLCVYSTRGYQ